MNDIVNIQDWKRDPENPEDYDGGLVKLPSGSWIDPAQITQVIPVDAAFSKGIASNATDSDYLPRVTVVRGENFDVIECADFSGAKSLADWFAALCNAARKLALRSSGGPGMS